MNAPGHFALRAELIDLADRREREAIEEFVAEHCGAIFHRPRWICAVEKATGNRAFGIAVRRAGELRAWLGLTLLGHPLFDRALVASGFGVGGGVLACDAAAGEAAAERAVALAREYSCRAIELRGGYRSRLWQACAPSHAGFCARLEADDEAQLHAIPRKQRAEIRKAMANDLKVTVGDSPKDLDAHYAVYSESVRNLGTPVFPKRLFESMIEAFRGCADILTVWQGPVPQASVLSFYHHGAVMPYWGGGIRAARQSRANELMYYALMRHARARGMERFDFGRSKIGSGPYRFKKNWGFAPQPLDYYRWCEEGRPARERDPDSPAYRRKVALWKRLPLPVANAIGPWIARGLA